ncbi:LOW QUALITY PROTEIN: HIRA-interacting protein 3-like [Brachionichthys hirsutus]|uniref:LOW QUALITY PROTEIN: HIRA-interacting protein 3-like n=1 Tax=Brachionichthys hirsutus TaxID=412623 RepID=UPI003604FFFA
MMASEKERVRRFVRDQLRAEPDLSTLTRGILRRRYLAFACRQSLSPDAKHFMKRVVQEELMKMQVQYLKLSHRLYMYIFVLDIYEGIIFMTHFPVYVINPPPQEDNDDGESELEIEKVLKKRKRENDEVVNGDEDESTTKKSRHQSNSSSDLEDDCKTGGEKSEEEQQAKFAHSGSEDEEREVEKLPQKTSGNGKRQSSSEDPSDGELMDSEKDGEESTCDDDPKEMVNRKASAAKKGETKSSGSHQGKKTGVDRASENNCISGNSSTDASGTDDEKETEAENTQDNKRISAKKESTRSRKGDDKAVVRLKRYIAICGVRRNYKKLLDGCHTVNAKVAVLKKELQDLGVSGHLSIQKCKKIRKKREKAQEVAELDISNIIETEGRPRRRAAWQEQPEPRSSSYARTLSSDSDSNEENAGPKGRRRAANWANLQGIISDNTESE